MISMTNVVELAYMASSLLFILGILKLGKVKTSKQGNLWAAYGMALAIGATMLLLITRGDWDPRPGEWAYQSHALAIGAMVLGSAIGWWLAVKVPMTSMPEFVAFFNGLGGAASMFVGLAEVPRAVERGQTLSTEGADFAIAVILAVIIGAVTLTGSLVAYAKLAGKLNKSRIGPLGSQGFNILLGAVCIGAGAWGGFFAADPMGLWVSNGLLTFGALLLGFGLTLPIGGADMPVAIALLNSYSGIAGMTTGFILKNNLLIVAGSLVGASGIILTQIMCKAMNRSLGNVLLGGMGEETVAKDAKDYKSIKSAGPEEIAMLLDGATSVVFVPGYGLAVAQAQHVVRELADLLQKRGAVVRYAIHPVAGRMPGHMNVLLAESDVPYEQLWEMERINGDFKNTDVVIVVGANDVVNPAAREGSGPIAGMPILNVDLARTVVVIK
ncbi:MAG: NAD(P)(+) transhydrogenase (Re/Si-specific) subunit beta, partial [Planctomycetota bacterium]